MFNLLSTKRENHFYGKKELPTSIFLIVTKNNEEEIRNLLYSLKDSYLFKQEENKIIVLDYYSFDHTKEVVMSFKDHFRNLEFLEKNSSVSLEALLEKYSEESIVQVINLKDILSNNRYISYEKYLKWYEKLLSSFLKKTATIDPIKVIKRMEADRQKVHHYISHSTIDLLSHMKMLLNHNKNKEDSYESTADLLQELLEKFKALDLNFDPDLYVKDSLFANVSGFLEDFTERTQIECSVKEKGEPRSLEDIVGLSLIRMLKEITEIIEVTGSPSKVDVEIQWASGEVKLHVKDNSTSIDESFIPKDSLTFIEERTALLNGKWDYTLRSGKMINFRISIPIYPAGQLNDVQE